MICSVEALLFDTDDSILFSNTFYRPFIRGELSMTLLRSRRSFACIRASLIDMTVLCPSPGLTDIRSSTQHVAFLIKPNAGLLLI